MEQLIRSVKEMIGFQLTAEQVAAFERYQEILIYYNAQFNLTAIRDVEGIRIKHFLDSLTCLQAMNLRKLPEKIVDVGTGAGFPAIPIKIIFPQIAFTLVESVHKKAEFCLNVIEKLKLKKVLVLPKRAEEIGQMKEHREKYDIALARAVASTPVLVEYLLPLVKIGGSVIMQKGERAHAEVQSAEKAIKILGGQVKKIIPVLLPGVVEERFLILLDKVAETGGLYPRKPGIPAKHPII